MGIWNKSPQVDPAVIAQLQARLNADPRMHTAPPGGWVKNPQYRSQLAKQILGSQLPDGYDVDIDGNVVYTNKTPILHQLAETAGPVAGMMIAGPAIEGALGAGGAGSGAGVIDGVDLGSAGVDGLATTGAAGGAAGAAAAGAPSFAGGAAGTGVIDGVDLGAAGVNGLATTGGGLLGKLAGIIKNPAEIAKLAALVPAFKTLTGDGSNGNSPFAAGSPLMDEATKSVALGNKRMEQAQPVYDSLVNMAYGRMPTRYRGAAPTGYSGDAAPEGAYQYTAPKFG